MTILSKSRRSDETIIYDDDNNVTFVLVSRDKARTFKFCLILPASIHAHFNSFASRSLARSSRTFEKQFFAKVTRHLTFG